jgi:hypothetical protein
VGDIISNWDSNSRRHNIADETRCKKFRKENIILLPNTEM